MGIIISIIIFGLIVFFHELGHFLLAKFNGIRVREFAVGMGPTLLSFERNGTKYALHLLPIGGFCAMDEDEEADKDDPSSFNNKSVWARISVILAGPVFNFILAFFMSVIIVLLAGYDAPILNDVEEGYPAYEAGIKAGDTIVKMGNSSIHIFREISMYNSFNGSEDVTIVYVHDGEKHTVTLTPKYDEELGYYRLGITGGTYEKANLLKAVQYGGYEVEYWINLTLKSIGMLFTGKVGMNDMSGAVGIVNVMDETYNSAKSYGLFVVIVELLNISILLSANLGVMNLLPIPALDGGRLVFLFVEAIRKKRVDPNKEGYVHLIGLAFLMALMLFVTINDIRQIFF